MGRQIEARALPPGALCKRRPALFGELGRGRQALNSRCSGFKRDGAHCTLPARGSNRFCWAHDPKYAEQRRKAASRAGKGKASKAIKELHELLKDLTDRVISGGLETSRGAAANQLISTRIRLLEHERRIKELEEFEERLVELEETSERQKEGRRYGY